MLLPCPHLRVTQGIMLEGKFVLLDGRDGNKKLFTISSLRLSFTEEQGSQVNSENPNTLCYQAICLIKVYTVKVQYAKLMLKNSDYNF